MLSTLLELAGLACLITGILILAGPAYALITAWPCLMFVGYSARDTKIGLRVKWRAFRARRKG